MHEKFTCRACEKISRSLAPFHATPRGWTGPNLPAMILLRKYGQHRPLNRQRDRYAREGVALSLSTLADQVGACTVVLGPLHDLIADHVLAAGRLHGDDTPVPVLATQRSSMLASCAASFSIRSARAGFIGRFSDCRRFRNKRGLMPRPSRRRRPRPASAGVAMRGG